MYAKLFTSILDSTVWLEDNATRIVWITFLAAMDQDGFARFGSPQNVANRANVTLEEAKNAIRILSSPDSQNPQQDHEGRRIEAVSGGFFIINAQKYRDIQKDEDRKERDRLRQQEYRARKRVAGNSDPNSRRVTPCHKKSRKSRQAEAEAEAEAEANSPQTPRSESPPEQGEFAATNAALPHPTLNQVFAYCDQIQVPHWVGEDFFNLWEGRAWRDRDTPVRNWKSLLNSKKCYWEADGRPPSRPGKDRNGNNGSNSFSRNVGTYNDKPEKLAQVAELERRIKAQSLEPVS